MDYVPSALSPFLQWTYYTECSFIVARDSPGRMFCHSRRSERPEIIVLKTLTCDFFTNRKMQLIYTSYFLTRMMLHLGLLETSPEIAPTVVNQKNMLADCFLTHLIVRSSVESAGEFIYWTNVFSRCTNLPNAVGREISACGVSQLKFRSILTPILMSFWYWFWGS